jgi:hypothetical protein
MTEGINRIDFGYLLMPSVIADHGELWLSCLLPQSKVTMADFGKSAMVTYD